MAEEVNERLEHYLKGKGLQPDALSKNALKLLVRTDEAIERRVGAIQDSRAAIRANKVTVTAIAEDAGVTRKTIYNNPVVLEYVSRREKEIEDAEAETIKGLRAKVADIEGQMSKLLQRDAEAEELKLELGRMQGLLSEREKLIRSLQDENAKLKHNLAEAEAKIPSGKGRIIELNLSRVRPK